MNILLYDDVMTWRCFPQYWPFLGESTRDHCIANTKGQTQPVMQSFDIFYYVGLNNLFNKQFR